MQGSTNADSTDSLANSDSSSMGRTEAGKLSSQSQEREDGSSSGSSSMTSQLIVISRAEEF